MQIEFKEVRAAFLDAHSLDDKVNKWALGQLEVANAQIGKWTKRTLTKGDLESIIIPHHQHKGSPALVLESGMPLPEVLKILEQGEYQTASPKCWANIQRQIDSGLPIFWSSQPLPGQPKFDNQPRLYHIDGLHRLLAKAIAGEQVEAFIAE